MKSLLERVWCQYDILNGGPECSSQLWHNLQQVESSMNQWGWASPRLVGGAARSGWGGKYAKRDKQYRNKQGSSKETAENPAEESEPHRKKVSYARFWPAYGRSNSLEEASDNGPLEDTEGHFVSQLCSPCKKLAIQNPNGFDERPQGRAQAIRKAQLFRLIIQIQAESLGQSPWPHVRRTTRPSTVSEKDLLNVSSQLGDFSII